MPGPQEAEKDKSIIDDRGTRSERSIVVLKI